MVELNDFGIKVKKRLIDLQRTQNWLINEVRISTGMFMDNGYLQKLMTGRATSAHMCAVILDVLGMQEAGNGTDS